MRIFAVILVLSAAFSAASEPASARPVGERPNVLLIVTDDQGWGDLGSHGNPTLDTPVLDRLADSGMRFEKFYVCPNCAPTRARLLTGRYHYRTGVSGTSRGEEVMHDHERTLAEVFRDNGYATGCFGKWHNGSNWPHHPNGQGFDEFVGRCQGHWSDCFDAELERNGRAESTEGFVTDVLTDRAIAFMKAQGEKDVPFLCYLPFTSPQQPGQAPENWLTLYEERGVDGGTAAAYAAMASIDERYRLAAVMLRIPLREGAVLTAWRREHESTEPAMHGMQGQPWWVGQSG